MGPSPMRLLAQLWRYCGAPVRRALVALAALAVGTGVLAVAQAIAIAWLITGVASGADLLRPAALLGVLLGVRGALALAGEPLGQWAGHRVSGALRADAVGRWLRSPVEDRPSQEEALTLAGDGATAAEPYIARFVPALVAAGVVPVLALAVLAWVDIWSALIVVLTLPLLPFFAALIGRHTQAETERKWSALGTLAAHFLDVVKGLPTLVGYGRAEHQVRVVGQVGERYRRSTGQALRTAFLSTTALELLATISVAIVAVVVGLRLAEGWIPLQVGLTAILLAPEAYWPIRRVGAEFHNAVDGQQAVTALLPTAQPPSPQLPTPQLPTPQLPTERVAGPDSTPPNASPGPVPPHRTPRWDVSLERVSYRHGQREVLRELTLTTDTRPGLTVITGASGSGKSTVLDLLAGIRRPTSGTVRAAGLVQYATQRPLIVPGTVAQNLRLVAPDCSADALIDVLRAVGLMDVLEVRDGLDTTLGDDGFGLSAGQRGRLSLARALLSSAPVVLLDEPTAHIAAASRPRVHSAIRAMAQRSRVIVATHDPELAEAAHADQQWRLHPTAAPADQAPAGTGEARRPSGPNRSRPGAAPAANSAIGADRDAAEAPNPTPRASRARLLLACFLGAMALSCGVALTATSGWLIVRSWQQPVLLTLLVAIVGVRAFGVGRPLFRYAERVVSHDIALSELTRARVAVFSRLIPLTPARLGRRRRGDLLTAVVRDVDDAVFATVRVTVPAVSTIAATLIATLIVAVALPSAGLALLIAATVVAAIGLAVAAAERTDQAADLRNRARIGRAVTTLVAGMDGYRAVLGDSAAAIDRAVAPLRRIAADQARSSTKAAAWRGTGLAATWAVLATTQVVVAVLAAAALTAGQLGAPLAALVTLTPMALADIWLAVPEICGQWMRARAAKRRLAAVLDQTPAVAEPTRAQIPEPPVTRLDLDRVGARWGPDAEPALRGLNLAVRPGSRTLLTGPNGSGKSSAFAVIARHLDHDSGDYTADGHPAQQLHLAAVRDRIAIADDDPHLFTGTVRANLLLAAPPQTGDAALIEGLRRAGLGAWFEGLPDGLDTPVTGATGATGASGVSGMSGGERTRLALARALISARPILLLDEPTAHLDHPTARTVIDDLLEVAGDRSVALISHDRFGITPERWNEVRLETDPAPPPASGAAPALLPGSTSAGAGAR